MLFAVAFLLAGCTAESQQQPQTAPKSVNAVQPKASTIVRYLHQTGTTKALDSVDLTARVTGYLKTIDYRDGSEVKGGNVCF